MRRCRQTSAPSTTIGDTRGLPQLTETHEDILKVAAYELLKALMPILPLQGSPQPHKTLTVDPHAEDRHDHPRHIEAATKAVQLHDNLPTQRKAF
jgi:hypothetical protein